MDMERHEMPDYQREQPEQQQVAVVIVPGRRDDDGARQLLLDAGRVLMLWGWAAVAAATATSASGRKNDDDGRPDTSGAAVHALLAFVVWLVGVTLVALVHVERRRFPRAARVGAAAANAVIDCFFVRPWN